MHEILQILRLRGIRVMVRKAPVDLAEELGDPTSQAAEKLRRIRARHPVAAIDGDLQRSCKLDVAGDPLEVRRRDVGIPVCPAAAPQIARVDAPLERLDIVAGKRVAGHYHLETVVVGRVVTSGYRDAGLSAELVAREIAHRRSYHADVNDVGSGCLDALAEGAAELRSGESSVAADGNGVASALEREGAERLPNLSHDLGGQRLANDASDVVRLENVSVDGHEVWKKVVRRLDSHPDPNEDDRGKPPCPPCSGCSSITAPLASVRVGSEDAGMKGSLRALMTSVGTAIALSHGLLLSRVQ